MLHGLYRVILMKINAKCQLDPYLCCIVMQQFTLEHIGAKRRVKSLFVDKHAYTPLSWQKLRILARCTVGRHCSQRELKFLCLFIKQKQKGSPTVQRAKLDKQNKAAFCLVADLLLHWQCLRHSCWPGQRSKMTGKCLKACKTRLQLSYRCIMLYFDNTSELELPSCFVQCGD